MSLPDVLTMDYPDAKKWGLYVDGVRQLAFEVDIKNKTARCWAVRPDSPPDRPKIASTGHLRGTFVLKPGELSGLLEYEAHLANRDAELRNRVTGEVVVIDRHQPEE